MKLTMEQVFELIKNERIHQDNKWGTIDERSHEIAGWLLILRKELEEAEIGWCKNLEGKHSSLRELVQVAAVAIACLQQYGSEGNG
jgi:hypothetical protein